MHVRYTVSSRGRPIGHTDLAFARFPGPHRAGWFHPNADGERVMPVVTALHVALQASALRHAAERGQPRREPPLDEALPSDLAEALQRVGELELTLHREDGSLVPTESVGLQDVEQLQVMAGLDL